MEKNLPTSNQPEKKEFKPHVPHIRLTVLVWDVKKPTHCSERVGDDVHGVMAYHLFWLGAPVYYTVLSHKNCELRGCNLRLNKQSGEVPHKVL